MPVALLQIQAVGEQDIYLTKTPQINIFKYVYYRYHNFAREIQSLHLNEVASFGKKTTVNVPFRGHMLSKIFLQLKLPALQKINGDYACWSDVLGYSIFDGSIDLELNGVIIDRLFPECLDFVSELEVLDQNFNKTILKSDVYRSVMYNAQKETELMIPLSFWFTKHYSSALPLMSMYGHEEVKIHFALKSFDTLIHYDGTAPPVKRDIVDSNLIVEYLYLDSDLVKTLQAEPHLYIIEQTVSSIEESIDSAIGQYNSPLVFENVCKEIFFALIEKDNVDNNNHFNYSRVDNGESIISEASLVLDGKHIFGDFKDESIFRTVLPGITHPKITDKFIYTIPFCIKSNLQQPTGGLNLSRFHDVTLSLKLKEDNNNCFLRVYAIVYNVLQIKDGRITFEYNY